MTGASQRLAWLVVAVALASAAANPARAQDIPEGQSCGGLFCDLGIIGHKTAPAPPAAPAPAAVPTTAVAVPAPAAAPTSGTHGHLVKARPVRRRVARLPHAPKTSPVAGAQPAGPPAPAARLAVRPAAPAEPPLAASVAAAPPPAVPAPAPVRPYQRPLIFQSIDPMLQ